jgi:hypothetical protein
VDISISDGDVVVVALLVVVVVVVVADAGMIVLAMLDTAAATIANVSRVATDVAAMT